MEEFSQEELAAALRSIFDVEGLNDQNVLIVINEGVLIEEATAAPAAAPSVAPAAAPAVAPAAASENVPSQQNRPPDESSD